MKIVAREALREHVATLLRTSPIVALLGPRQSGKTTLAAQVLAERKGERFDLENPRDAARLSEPMTALESLRGLVVIDEVQRHPDLFPVLRVLADRRPLPARFLVLGSASPELLRQTSETLAGRIRFVELGGFSFEEVGAASLRRLWARGGFPRSYLARTDAESFGWREDFIRTFIERDVGTLGFDVRPVVRLRRFWSMLAHRHAQLWNGAEIGGALGESYPTVKRHLDILTGALVVRQLPPWLPNMEKRLVKSPKVFIRDSGLLHALLGVETPRALEGHPKLGASWEGFVLEEVVRRVGERDVYFWATHAGAELDILIQRGRAPIGIEVKWGDAPQMTKSMGIALSDLGLRRLAVIYPGPKRYSLHKNVEVVPIGELDTILD
jgi:predicted AAA+ superfamily ATPase